MKNKYLSARKALPRRNALVVALALGMGVSGLAYGQATSGAIFGSAPDMSGETVLVVGSSGVTREVTVRNGRFTIDNLPLGTYTVTLRQNGETVNTRNRVSVQVGAGTEVTFNGGAGSENAQNLSGVEVSANALPTIDVTNVNSTTTVTSQQLAMLPLAHNAEAIALLAPGAVQTSGYFGNYVSFGGASATENAYYLNGFNTTDPLEGFGGMTLPYGTIDQQQMLTGGYGAAYGRSDGGVLSQVGKRGTNEWHFGGQIRWVPEALRAGARSQYLPDGVLRTYRGDNNNWETTYSAYIGGPLIKDKLFMFASAQMDKREGQSVGATSAPYKRQYGYDDPSYYLKLDWNINDSNILELTGAQTSESYNGTYYDFDYDTYTEGGFNSYDTHTKNLHKLWVAKYTSYITDDITLTAMYGKLHHTYYSETPGYDPTTIFVGGTDLQNPAITGGKPIINGQTVQQMDDPKHKALNTNLRVDLTWRIGDHTLTAGIDNQRTQDINDGEQTSGPEGYAWIYDQQQKKGVGDPNAYIIGGPDANGPGWEDKLWVAPTGGDNGYYVQKYIYANEATVKVQQRAQYIQDAWQINDRWLLQIGIRNDQFTNYNPDGVPYVNQRKPQWAPRLGFTWDVFGDSSFKVYGNAGRYYLAMPASVALRAAGGSLYTRTYYTYSGIDSDGYPKGLNPINTSRGKEAPISVNSEYGQPRDPKVAASKNLKSEYQDEFILGFDKKLGDSWVYGAKATYRKLRNGIDDVGDNVAIARKMVKLGYIDDSQLGEAIDAIPASILFNPTQTNDFLIPKLDGSGYWDVPVSMDDFGFSTSMKRSYAALDLYLEHPFDGTWFGRVTYTWSHNYGNSEGQVRSDIGQDDVSATEDWDYAELMEYANGDLSNDRRHQIKAYGAWKVTPEWMLSGNLVIASGTPRTCLGNYGPNDDGNPGLGYAGSYHWCFGHPYPPGTQHNPWQYRLDLGVEYRPAFADHKLAIALDVNNVFNRQSVRQKYAFEGAPFYTQSDSMPLYWTSPRYVALTLSYDY